MYNLSPSPFTFRAPAVRARAKRLNTNGSSSSGIGSPAFITRMCACPAARLRSTTISVSGAAYFTAFDSRFASTCSSASRGERRPSNDVAQELADVEALQRHAEAVAFEQRGVHEVGDHAAETV